MYSRIIPILIAVGLAACGDDDDRVPGRPGSEDYRTNRPVDRPPVERPAYSPANPDRPIATRTPAAQDNDDNDAAPADNDNTAVNERDRNGDSLTPGDQSNSEDDIKITAAIRKKVVGAQHLSTNADNVKIITNGGIVTLRGVVDSQDEKAAVEILAKEVDGVVRVDNQLELNLQ
jgi:hypothetical protein